MSTSVLGEGAWADGGKWVCGWKEPGDLRPVSSLAWLPFGLLWSAAIRDWDVDSTEMGFLVGPGVLAPAPVLGSYPISRHCGRVGPGCSDHRGQA